MFTAGVEREKYKTGDAQNWRRQKKRETMADFLEYLKRNFGERSFQETARSFMLWIIFFALILAVYWNLFNVIRGQLEYNSEEQAVVKQYSVNELSPPQSGPEILNVSLESTDRPAVLVTVKIT